MKDSHALPRLQEIMDTLKGAKYFSTLDVRSGFYQVEIEEDHKPYTAFSAGPLGSFEFQRMAFGSCNSPALFQQLMERVMGELQMKECFTFIDDTKVHGSSFEENLQRLEQVFEKVRKSGLRLNPEKCVLFKRVHGHAVSEMGVTTDPERQPALLSGHSLRMSTN